jgi:hypothetical protein
MANSSRQPSAVFPSVLIFGPQTNLPSAEVLAELRQDLVENPRLIELVKAINDLPRVWDSLTKFDLSLNPVQGSSLGGLKQWLDEGVLPQNSASMPNVSGLPLTVLLQILLYVRYLNELQVNDAQSHVIQYIKNGGAQGFCVGFLTAIVVSCSGDERDIAKIGAVAMRLATCVGAYVDQDGIFACPPNKTSCIAVRWRTGSKEDEALEIMQSYREVRLPPIRI